MSNNNTYGVVEFIEEKAVEVVPSSWIESSKGVCYCSTFNKLKSMGSCLFCTAIGSILKNM